MLLFHFILLNCESLYINILYEKIVDPDLELLYKDIVTSIMDKYNVYFKKANIEIIVQEVLSYSVYSQMTEYKDLQKFSGTDDLSSRMEVIIKMNKAILLIASSLGEQNDIFYDLKVPCLSKYITTFSSNNNLDVDTVSAINGAIERWLKDLIHIDIPKPFGIINLGHIRKFADDVQNSEFKENLEMCVKKNKIIENKYDFGDQLKFMIDTIPNIENISDPNIKSPPEIDMANEILGKEKSIIQESFKNKEINKNDLVKTIMKEIENKMNVKKTNPLKKRRFGNLTRFHEHVEIKKRNT